VTPTNAVTIKNHH